MIKVFKITKLYPLIMVFTLIFCLLIYPETCIQGAKDGIGISLYSVFPSVFPFMVATKYLMYSGLSYKISKKADKLLGFVFKIPENSSVSYLFGALSGFPVGASVLSDLVDTKSLKKENAEIMMGFCNNASPVFIISTVGAVFFNDIKAGYILFLVHILSGLISAFILRNKYVISTTNTVKSIYYKNPFTKAIKDSSSSMITVCSYIIFFSVITNLLNIFGKGNLFVLVLSGFLEISSGINMLSKTTMPLAFKYSLASLFLGFSGICVYFQVSSVGETSGIGSKYYIKTKCLIALLSFVISFLIFWGKK